MKRWKDEWKYTVARAEEDILCDRPVCESSRAGKADHYGSVPERKGDRRIKLFKRLEPEVQLFRFEKYERLYEDLNEEEKKEQDHFIYNGLKYAHKVIDTRQCDMVVLDEVLGLLDLGLLKTEELVEMLENRSDDQTIIMTGRQIPEALIPYADAVYEISTIKES